MMIISQKTLLLQQILETVSIPVAPNQLKVIKCLEGANILYTRIGLPLGTNKFCLHIYV